MVRPIAIGPAAVRARNAPRRVQGRAPVVHMVGFSFGGLLKHFAGMLKHVAAIAIDIGATSLGLPPGAGFAIAELLMRAHAGDPKALAEVQKKAKASKNVKLYMQAVSRAIKAHPDYAAFKASAANMHKNAA